MNQVSSPPISDELIKSIFQRYNLQPDMWNPLGGVENFVFEFVQDQKEYIIRIGDNLHMDYKMVIAEIEWVEFLNQHRIPVTNILKSVENHLVESFVVDDKSYNVVIFSKIDGELIDFDDPLSWDQKLINNWGKLLGKLHTTTKQFKPINHKRYSFFISDSLIDQMLPSDDQTLIASIKKIHRNISSLSKQLDGYGLIHSDLHPGNFFVRENKIVGLIDFDRACYKWFISDIAIALFYPLFQSSLRHSFESQKKFVQYFLPKLLKGYEQENKLDRFWFTKLTDFIRMRDAILYLYLPKGEEFQKFRTHLSDRILNKHPILEYIDEYVHEYLIKQ